MKVCGGPWRLMRLARQSFTFRQLIPAPTGQLRLRAHERSRTSTDITSTATSTLRGYHYATCACVSSGRIRTFLWSNPHLQSPVYRGFLYRTRTGYTMTRYSAERRGFEPQPLSRPIRFQGGPHHHQGSLSNTIMTILSVTAPTNCLGR